MTKNEGRTFV